MDIQGEGIAAYAAGPNANFPVLFLIIIYWLLLVCAPTGDGTLVLGI